MAAEKREYTPYQQKAIRNYYRNQEAIRQQALADLVSDVYLATTDAKKSALWKRAQALLEGLGVPASQRLPILEKRDVRALADLAAKGFQSDRRAEWQADDREARSGGS